MTDSSYSTTFRFNHYHAARGPIPRGASPSVSSASLPRPSLLFFPRSLFPIPAPVLNLNYCHPSPLHHLLLPSFHLLASAGVGNGGRAVDAGGSVGDGSVCDGGARGGDGGGGGGERGAPRAPAAGGPAAGGDHGVPSRRGHGAVRGPAGGSLHRALRGRPPLQRHRDRGHQPRPDRRHLGRRRAGPLHVVPRPRHQGRHPFLRRHLLQRRRREEAPPARRLRRAASLHARPAPPPHRPAAAGGRGRGRIGHGRRGGVPAMMGGGRRRVRRRRRARITSAVLRGERTIAGRAPPTAGLLRCT